VIERLDRLVLLVGAVAMALLAVLIFAQVVLRYLFAWYLLLDLVILALFVLIVATGVEAVGYNHSMRSLGLQVRLSYVMAGIPLFFGIAALFLIDELRRRGKRR
jgi:TRAP-type C4-dicarboxylate transport system permease small subunit